MEMTKTKYKLVIFDVDGTILDTSEGLLASTIYMINKLGYPMPEQEVLCSFVGPRIQDSLERVWGLQGSRLKEAADIFRNHYKEGDVLRACPYEGVYEVMDTLKKHGIHIAVATNKRQDFTDVLMERYGFLPYVEVVYGTDIMGKFKKVDLIQKCIEHFSDCSLKECVMVGDSDYDAQAAHEAGIDFVGVTYGYGFLKEADIGMWPHIGICDKIISLTNVLIHR